MTKITIDRAVVEQALDALESLHLTLSPESVLAISLDRRIAALRAALAQEQTEPVETFDEVWNAIDWDKWRKEPIRELVQMIHSKTSPRIAQGREPAQEPVARVELMTTGGSAGLATRIVEIDDHLRERLRPGQLLYTAPPQRKPIDVDALGIPHGQQLQPAQQQEPVTWGVDWGRDGDQSCVSIIKKHADGTAEVVAVEYSPPQRPAEPEPRNQCGETCQRAKLCAVCARGLAEPVQEPVAWRWPANEIPGSEWRYSLTKTRECAEPLYTAPPQSQAGLEPVGWNWMQDGVPFGPAYYGTGPDDDIARVAAKHGKTVRLLYAHPLT